MDRFAAMLILLGVLVSTVLLLLALFAVAPIICSCLFSLMYSIYLFMAYEEMGVHHAQEFENRFWTIFALLLSTALLFAKDSPIAFGLWSPSLGFLCVLLSGYAMHIWDRHLHRIATSQPVGGHLRRRSTTQSLLRLQDLGIPVSAQLEKIKECLTEIDQLLIPSTINNYINQRFILSKEREIIKIIEDCDARALNYLISHVKLGLLFYKIKDHHNFNGKNRTELINLLAVERLQILTVISRVILLHSLQLLKLRANPRAEYWVQNILLHTHQDDLSELKTLTDAKGDYFSMNKLIYDDIRSESVRQTILSHFRREAAVQETYMLMGTRRKNRVPMQRRKVLSDVDDTLLSSGGMYPAGVDKRYARKTVYPGVLAFYRELDLGTEGPDEWEDDQVGNLVFLSARPHFYRDMSEKHNFAKFEMLRANTLDGRKGLHTTPSLLAGDLSSGSQYMMRNDFEPLAKKKFDNFRRYVSIYPEYKHFFVCDNGQGDVRAAEIMFDNFPYEFEGVYVHVVQDLQRTYGYEPSRWRQKEFAPYFFRCYPEAALHAASRSPPLIRVKGLQRICHDAVNDFLQIKKTQFASDLAREERRLELNQAIWRANEFLVWHSEQPVNMILAEQRWKQGEKVRTPYGIAIIRDFDPVYNLYDVDLDWRPLDVQVLEYLEEQRKAPTAVQPRRHSTPQQRELHGLATVTEIEDEEFASALGPDEGKDVFTGTEVSEFAIAAIGDEAEDIVMEHNEPGRDNVGQQEVGESSAESSNRPSTRRAASLGGSAEMTAKAVESFVRNTVRQSVSDDVGSEKKLSAGMSGVRAQVSGRFISKYFIPSLPVFESKKKATSIFPFMNKTSELKAVETKVLETKIQLFKKGEEFLTPFGPATVVEHREKQGIVVVDMVGWIGIGYLQQSTLKRMPISLFGSLLRQLSGAEGSQKGLDFPYARGTLIATPFGQGKVERPLKLSKSSRISPSATIGLSLESWKLANGTRPMLYCTVETAQAWKDKKPPDGSSLLSTLNTIVSSSRSLLVPFLSHKKLPIEERKVFKKYFKDAAAVCTKYGYGRVDHFRETDGFYQVSLVQWTLSNGSHPKAFIRNDEITYRLAKGCQEGHPVLTSLGLSGKLASVEPTSGVHIVTIPSAGMVCYLQPESVIRPLKAAAGEEVLTQYGEGRVSGYNSATDIYTIELAWNAKLYARCDLFDRVGDGVPDSEGRFGVDWLLRFLFFRPEARSRSNSVVSGTPSNRSGT